MAFKLFRAWFYDEKGDFHGQKSFKKSEKTFNYENGTYNVDIKNGSFKKDYPYIFPFIAERRTYTYNRDNSNPFKFDKKGTYELSPRLYNINLETKVAEELNNLSKKGILDFLTPKMIIAILVIGAIIYYIASGGQLFTSTP